MGGSWSLATPRMGFRSGRYANVIHQSTAIVENSDPTTAPTLGSPSEVAARYVAENIMARAESSRTAWMIMSPSALANGLMTVLIRLSWTFR